MKYDKGHGISQEIPMEPGWENSYYTDSRDLKRKLKFGPSLGDTVEGKISDEVKNTKK